MICGMNQKGEPMYRILIVEDDRLIASSIREGLKKWGYDAHIIEDFEKVLESFHQLQPHLVLMDVKLPYYDGYSWCRQIRQTSKVPILFVSSALENLNIIMAVQMGADDYVTKPFEIELLEAKIRALLRRTYDFAGSTEILEHEGICLNTQEMTVSYEGQSRELTKNEFRILEALLQQKGGVISRDELMNRLWQSDLYIDDNTLTVNVTRLRQSLREIGLEDCIKTKRGVGYYVGRR